MSTLFELIEKASGITCDSRQVKPGDIFFALKGRLTDGNQYVQEAVRHGAIAIVTDQPPPPLSIPVIVTANARKTLAEASARFYNQPSRDLSVIGVTGTNGKTTITYMLEQILSHAGLKCGLIGTVKVNTGQQSFPSRLTTPDAISLHNYLAQMRANGVTHVPMEVSAQGVEMHRVDTLQFSCGILANISPDHLDFHGDFDSYFAAKKAFINLLGKDTPLIINIGDPCCRTIASGFDGRLITAGVNTKADITASAISTHAYTSRFELSFGELVTVTGQRLAPTRITVNLSVPGLHNIENALLAAAAAIIHGVPVSSIAAALASFRCVERRMNIFHLNARTVIDDTALNPASISAVLNSLPTFRCRRLFVVNAIRGNRGAAINQANAKVLADYQKKLGFSLAITASVGSVNSSDAVQFDEKAAFIKTLNHSQVEYTYFSNLESAISSALTQSRPNDLLALLGAQGMDAGRDILTALTASSSPQPHALYSDALTAHKLASAL
ncbi:MAG: Mur ligase family protein [Negativicutes bacterium]